MMRYTLKQNIIISCYLISMFSLNVSSESRFEIFKGFIKRHPKKWRIFICIIIGILCAQNSFGVGSQTPTAQASLLNSEINDGPVESIIDYIKQSYKEKGITFVDDHKFLRNRVIRNKALNILKSHIDAFIDRGDKKKITNIRLEKDIEDERIKFMADYEQDDTQDGTTKQELMFGYIDGHADGPDVPYHSAGTYLLVVKGNRNKLFHESSNNPNNIVKYYAQYVDTIKLIVPQNRTFEREQINVLIYYMTDKKTLIKDYKDSQIELICEDVIFNPDVSMKLIGILKYFIHTKYYQDKILSIEVKDLGNFKEFIFIPSCKSDKRELKLVFGYDKNSKKSGLYVINGDYCKSSKSYKASYATCIPLEDKILNEYEKDKICIDGY